MSIFQNRLTLSLSFEIHYFVEILPENVNIDTLLREKRNIGWYILIYSYIDNLVVKIFSGESADKTFKTQRKFSLAKIKLF